MDPTTGLRIAQDAQARSRADAARDRRAVATDTDRGGRGGPTPPPRSRLLDGLRRRLSGASSA